MLAEAEEEERMKQMMYLLKGEKLASMLNRKDRFIDNYMIG